MESLLIKLTLEKLLINQAYAEEFKRGSLSWITQITTTAEQAHVERIDWTTFDVFVFLSIEFML